MILNVKVTNKHNGNIFSYELEGNPVDGFLYNGEHMQEVADNKIREVNNHLMLPISPLRTIKPGKTATTETILYKVEITAT